ncbi:ATP synthase-coupling factor 6, mitochondrial-like [Eupeodes corollae]|uniref:ATP synthase-coupling factor 6, mitochondrial-like n=1 Tax=Eupeodes corollae TaxID=290404 RepID=UPI002491D7AD|nr:ATP synthase-coupling factor 6, mitochondrial-like [Eupeodes corollae]
MMSTSALLKVLRPAVCASRNFGVCSPALNKATDPIQKLFLEKIQEYRSKSSGGKMVDSNADIERELKNELERVAKQFDGGAGVDMTQFPAFKFEDPQIDSITTTN